ncbi:MAG TPA: GntR family transcriptional regulator, partial [Oxalobacteraceae bacterium]|nr:GntR family transcriptional regulator [Oxalobacteraceae bacterium]
MASSKIVVTRISDEIAHQIEARILEGSLKAGDSLPPERQFAEEFGVSRSSLREAIQKLESRGLLTSRQGGGTYVTDSFHSGFVDPWIGAIGNHPSLAPELFEFRSMIEAQAAAWAAQRATDADLAHLNSVFMQLDAAYRTSDRAAQVQADVAFHQAIADAAHNVLVSQLTASLIKILHEQVAATI